MPRKGLQVNKIFFSKLKNRAVIPTKREEDGCYDLYACIEEPIIIEPLQIKLVPTGICNAFDNKYRISIRERGSNTKFGAIIMAGQIDSGYRGEWFVAIFNANPLAQIQIGGNKPETTLDSIFEGDTYKTQTVHIPDNKAIAQLAVEIVPEVEIAEVNAEDIKAIASERGEGKLGSSGK